ncbi:MAG: DUF1735 domain-containing protein [Bacteroidetes bacterium]|nr:MAG: DUF1735 domain-containing protein [Bacteroidota bacterium]
MKRILIVTGFALAMAGCKVQNDVTPDAPYTGAVQVAFNNYQDENGNYGFINKDLAIKDSVFNYDIEVKLSNTTSAAGQDIKVYLSKADGVIGDYNTAHGTVMTPVPTISAALQYDVTQPIIIKKGTRRASFRLSINPSRLNVNLQNAIGFRINRAEGAEVAAGDQSTLVVNFNTRNGWDGIYAQFTGFVHPTNAALGPVRNYQPVYMITSGASSVDSYIDLGSSLFATQVVGSGTNQVTYFTGVNPRFIVAPNNFVTLGKAVPTSVDFLQNSTEAAASLYYPTGIPGVGFTAGRKTIVAHFRWNAAGGDRVCKDTFVFLQNR